jgi:hypothetical protein
MKTKPWMMLVAMMAGWLNRQQQDAIEFLGDEHLKATGMQSD